MRIKNKCEYASNTISNVLTWKFGGIPWYYISIQFCQWWYFSTHLYIYTFVLYYGVKYNCLVFSYRHGGCFDSFHSCSDCLEDGLNSLPDNMQISSLKINFQWKPSFISMQTSKFKRLDHTHTQENLVNTSLNMCYLYYTVIKMCL